MKTNKLFDTGFEASAAVEIQVEMI